MLKDNGTNPAVASSTAGSTNEGTSRSLYERLGGAYGIAAVVDDLLESRARIAREKLGQNDAENAARRPGLKYLVTEMLCEMAGGPQRYTGLSMIASHKNLVITPQDWRKFMQDLCASLSRFQVAAADQEELIRRIERTRAEIVTRPDG